MVNISVTFRMDGRAQVSLIRYTKNTMELKTAKVTDYNSC